MAHQAFWVTGIQITDNEAVPIMAETLASVLLIVIPVCVLSSCIRLS